MVVPHNHPRRCSVRALQVLVSAVAAVTDAVVRQRHNLVRRVVRAGDTGLTGVLPVGYS